MRHLIELIVFVLLSAPLAILPLGLSRKAGELLGLLFYLLWGSKRRIAVENLRAAVERNALSIPAPPERVIRENFMQMGRSLSEVIKIYYGLGDSIVNGVRVEGLENFKNAKARGKGIIYITGHCGNWELMQLVVSLKVGELFVVVRMLNNPYINSVVERTRGRYGSSVVYKQGALKKLLSTLKEGGSAGVLMDQSVFPEEGVVIDFLGAPAWTTKTPAALAKRTSAAVLPIFMRRAHDGYVVTIHPMVEMSGDEVEDTKRMSGYIEDYIRENPSGWLWMHRRWKRTEETANFKSRI
jgi:KDO2-lipid IV(A) lauroyltransferase